MTDTRAQHEPRTAFELFESVTDLISGAAVGAATLPGLTLCVPALGMLVAVVIAALAAAAALVTLAGAILAIPYLVVRCIRSIRTRRAARAPGPTSAPAGRYVVHLPVRGTIGARSGESP